MKAALAIDFGGTKTIVGIVREDGQLLAQRRFATDTSQGALPYFQACLNELGECMRESHVPPEQIAGIGVTVPGLADPVRGMLLHAPFLGLKEVPVAATIRSLWPDYPVFVDNDVNACALAEMKFGGALACGSFVWVTVSTGIGGAVVIDGKVWEGEHHLAGELGHIVVEWDDDANVCGCGNCGCLEVHGSGKAIERNVRRYLAGSGRDSELAAYFARTNAPVTAESAAAAAMAGIEAAAYIFRQAGRHIGKMLSYTVNMLNPAAVFIGGGVSRSFSLLQPGIMDTFSVAVIGEANKSVPILPTGLGYEAGLLGAASLAFTK
jgi:glucokinase